MARIALGLRRAHLHTQLTAGTVFDGDLQGVLFVSHVLPTRGNRFKGGGCFAEVLRIVDFRADHGVRTDQDALTTLDAERLIPRRNCHGDVAFLPLRGTGREGAIDWKGAHGERIALARDDWP